MSYESQEEYDAAMDDMANEEMEANAAAAEAEAEQEMLRQEEIHELEKQISYHEKKIAEYMEQIKNLSNRKL